MRTPQRTRLERLAAQAPEHGDPPLFLYKATDEDFTEEQQAAITQAEAEGRAVEVLEFQIVVCCPACNGPVPRAGGGETLGQPRAERICRAGNFPVRAHLVAG